MNSSIYIIKHKPYYSIFSSLLKTISPQKCDDAEISSDTLINIGDLNILYAEFTTFYWVWKNVKNLDVVGFFHYRRYLSLNFDLDEIESLGDIKEKGMLSEERVNEVFEKWDMVVPIKVDFQGQSLINQYYLCHDPYYMQRALYVIQRDFPYMIESFNAALSRDKGYFCNLFISKWEVFDDYMNFIFHVFEEIRKEMPNSFQPKILAYLGERLFNGYIEYIKTKLGKRVKEAPIIFIKSAPNGYVPSVGWSFD